MKRSWTITLLQHEQPDTAAWGELCRLVTWWNANKTPQFAAVMGFMWHINFDVEHREQLTQLLQGLDAIKQKNGASYHLASRGILEEDDYARADFIEILGVDPGSESRPFLLNAETALAPSVPCSRCGWQDLFDSRQVAPFVVDEALLDLPIDDMKPRAGGWDLVNLPNGEKLISYRMASLLQDNGVKGYELHQVINGASGQPSRRLFQISANSVVLTPCMEHSHVEGDPFCPVCGTAHGELEEYFWIRSSWIGDDELVSRHPGRGAMLYVSQRLYGLLLAAALNGIYRNDLLFVCHHDGPE